MATCALTTGFPRYDCETVTGGIREIYILPFDDFTSVTVAAHEISAITEVGAPTWYKYELNEEVGNLTCEETKDLKNNTVSYVANCAFTLNKMEAAKANELSIMVIQQVVAIILTENGEYFFIGDDRGAHKAGGTNNSTTGTAFGGELQGYSVNLMASQKHDVYEVQASVVAGLTIS